MAWLSLGIIFGSLFGGIGMGLLIIGIAFLMLWAFGVFG